MCPGPDTDAYLPLEEVRAELTRLFQNPVQIAKAQGLAGAWVGELRHMHRQDLLQEATTLLWSGERRWKRGMKPLPMLNSTMRSIANNERTKRDYDLSEDLKKYRADDPRSGVLEVKTTATDPYQIAEYRSELAALQKAVQGEDELELLLEAMAEGLRGPEAADALGWDIKQYDAARKRLRRRIDELATNGKTR